jgi:hypothetical protein
LTKAEPVLPATHQPPPVREAILAVAAEKRFDLLERTRRRAERLLSRWPFANAHLKAIIGPRVAAFREQFVAEKRQPATEISAGSGSPVGFN